MQKRPTNQTKPTNWTPAPTYQPQGPPVSHPEEGGGQNHQRRVGRTHGSAEPALAPVQVHFGGKSDLILLKAVMNVSMYTLGRNQPQGATKGASLLTLNTHHLEASLSTLSCDLYSLG